MWRSLLGGIHQFHKYWIDNDHASMYNMSCQGMEHQIGNAKLFCKKQGCKTMDVVAQTGDYLDLNCTGSVYRNQIQLKKILNQLLQEKKLIFDPNKTKIVEDNLMHSMPNVNYKLIVDILSVKLGSDIPSSLTKITSAVEDHNDKLKHARIHQLLQDKGFDIGDIDELDQQSNQYLREKLRIDAKENKSKQKCNTKNNILQMRDACNDNV